jgi:hypothetical protein
MRVVIKPLGLIVIGILVLVAIIVPNVLRSSAQPAAAAPGSSGTGGDQPVVTPVSVRPTLVKNPSFEEAVTDKRYSENQRGKYWDTFTFSKNDGQISYTENKHGAHSGAMHGTHYGGAAYEVYTYQMFTGLKSGKYTMRGWVRVSENLAEKDVMRMQVEHFDAAKSKRVALAPAEAAKEWVQLEIRDIAVTSGECMIGFYSKAAGGRWMMFDDVEFVKQD